MRCIVSQSGYNDGNIIYIGVVGATKNNEKQLDCLYICNMVNLPCRHCHVGQATQEWTSVFPSYPRPTKQSLLTLRKCRACALDRTLRVPPWLHEPGYGTGWVGMCLEASSNSWPNTKAGLARHRFSRVEARHQLPAGCSNESHLAEARQRTIRARPMLQPSLLQAASMTIY